MINKAKDEAARINGEAKDRENDAKALSKLLETRQKKLQNVLQSF